MSLKSLDAQIRIVIKQFEHADDERPILTYFSGIVQTPIGDSPFYSIWVPATNESTIKIFEEDVQDYVIDCLNKEMNLNNITIDMRDRQGWTDYDIIKQWELMINGIRRPESLLGL